LAGCAKSSAQQSPDPTQARLNTKAHLDSLKFADIEALTTGAQAGNAEAQYWGLAYREGKQVPKDEEQAARWLKKSAEQGYALAQREFGLMAVHQTPSQGEQWLRWAAERGDAEAQLWLGVGYEQSWFGNNDPQEALQWFKKAVEQVSPTLNV
jgi:TPR repeat protein